MNSLQLNINLNFQQLIEVVKQLTPKEKIKLNDMMWDENMTIPTEHQKIVIARTEKSKRNPKRMLNWDEVSKTL